MKKLYFFVLVLNSIVAFGQFGSKVKFTPENKIKYEILKNQLDIDIDLLRKKIKEQKYKLETQDGSTNFVNYKSVKDSICDVYVNNVSKLVSPDQIQDFWKVVKRRMDKTK